MTTYNVLVRMGPVEVVVVQPELSGGPTKYMLDCDHAAHCEFGATGLADSSTATKLAKQHEEFHEEHGPMSTDWMHTFRLP